MTDVGIRIKARRKELHLSAEKLAAIIGCAPATVYRYESGAIMNVSTDKLLPIADALHTTPAYLMGWTDNSEQQQAEAVPQAVSKARSLPDNLKPISEMKHYYVPMLDGVNSGEVVLRETNYDMVIGAPKKADYALRVDDESMSPFYIVGDIVYIKMLDDVSDGDRGVVIVDDKALLRRIYHVPGGLLLISDNPQYPTITAVYAEHEYLRILGRACGHTRLY